MKKSIFIILILSICLAFPSCGIKKGVSKTESIAESSSMQSELQSKIESSDSVASNPPSSKVNSSSKITGSKPLIISQSSSSIPKKTVVNVTIPEGFTISEIGKRLEDEGVCKKSDFLSAVNSYNYSSYSVTNSINNVSKRCYKLEGYLYPSTYQFYKNTNPSDVITKILKTTQSKIASKYSYPGMTTDQIITLASLIQKETAKYDDMVNVSAVLHNRLKIKMQLQVDCTVIYLKYYIPSNLIDTYKYFYNTRRCLALPVGAICSPGALALKAAVTPSKTDYLYFKSDSSGKYTFSKTPIASASSSVSSALS